VISEAASLSAFSVILILCYRYSAPFKNHIDEWVQNLSNSLEISNNWLLVQNLWIYLEAVFTSADVVKQLAVEVKRFQNVDKSWQRVMQRVHSTPNVIDCCVGDDFLAQMLPHLLEQLEVCQKSLTGYIPTNSSASVYTFTYIFHTSIFITSIVAVI